MAATEIKVSTAPAMDQNSLRFGRFPETMMRMETMRTMAIGKRGSALSITIGQSFISFNAPPSMCPYFLKMRMMMPSAMAASAAAIPMMIRVKAIP